jgi:hypothetical protein
MDYAVASRSPLLVCRTCCHDNIAGNADITHRPTLINWGMRFKNWLMRWMRDKEKFRGYYFSEAYGPDAYPRSEAARGLTDSAELVRACRNSVDSDVCRAIIDLDRYLHLVEKGYDVWYRGELFVAERNNGSAEHAGTIR